MVSKVAKLIAVINLIAKNVANLALSPRFCQVPIEPPIKLPSRHGGTINSRRVTSPLVRLVKGQEMWEVPDHPQSVLPQNWVGNEKNSTITCMVLKATTNDKRHLALCHDEVRGPRSGLCRSGGISNNDNKYYFIQTQLYVS
ncbi:uncharacterized protein TNCV_1598611 [Trichonephila clavipes]|nr:uncharacterized protein TNCV_1598611 [Trichonephila clavipes]